MKRLIVNADDLGLTAGVNRGIIEAHQKGIVTSATLMANGAAFSEAVSLASRNPRLAVGCHVDLIQLAPTLPADEIKTLTANGRFRPGLPRFAAAALRGRLSADEMAAEAAAQMRRLQAAGISISHFDTHKHTHVFPHVLRALLLAAKACGVQAVRNPFEPVSATKWGSMFSRPRLAARFGAVQGTRWMGSQFRREVERAGMVTTDGTLGVAFTGHMDQKLLSAVIASMPEGTWELVTHPGYSDSQLTPLSKLTASRGKELLLLTSGAIRDCLQRSNVQLISYRDLTG